MIKLILRSIFFLIIPSLCYSNLLFIEDFELSCRLKKNSKISFPESLEGFLENRTDLVTYNIGRTMATLKIIGKNGKAQLDFSAPYIDINDDYKTYSFTESFNKPCFFDANLKEKIIYDNLQRPLSLLELSLNNLVCMSQEGSNSNLVRHISLSLDDDDSEVSEYYTTFSFSKYLPLLNNNGVFKSEMFLNTTVDCDPLPLLDKYDFKKISQDTNKISDEEFNIYIEKLLNNKETR